MTFVNKSLKRSYHIPLESIIQNDPKVISSGMKLADKYYIKRELAGGSFAKIYECVDILECLAFAAKIVPHPIFDPNAPKDDLSKERTILLKLANEKGFPRVKELLGTFSNDILIMSLLGRDLKTLQTKFRLLSLKTVLMIGIQVIERLRSLHNAGYIHREMKPENLVAGINEWESLIHFVDFGLSIPYLDENKAHIPFKRNSNSVGTVYYLSVYGHLGYELSRRDDLISLGYVLLHLLFGELPWAKVTGTLEEKILAIYKMKSKISAKNLCKGLPEEFSEYFSYVNQLEFSEEPNYQYLSDLFSQTLTNKGLSNDNLFDWILKPKPEHATSSFNANQISLSLTSS